MSQLCMYKMLRYSVLLAFICMAGQTIRRKDIHASTSKTLRYNPIKADAGQAFFHELIHDNESFRNVNQDTMCTLLHFFIREASQNGRLVQFSSGTFVLYDFSERFYTQIMRAKQIQKHSNEHRSGYFLRLKHFVLDFVNIFIRLFRHNQVSDESPFIYLRGDESSHFHERGNQHVRWNVYPAYGMDFHDGCLPNRFLHILFGQLKGLSRNGSQIADRIYIKPEHYGLQKFDHYLAHTADFLQSFLRLSFCQWINRWESKFCHADDVFNEWTDAHWIKGWTLILSKIKSLSFEERRRLQNEAKNKGIFEIYRQTLLFEKKSDVVRFQNELRTRYGDDVMLRKGNEIILTSEQLLKRSSILQSISVEQNDQCQVNINDL